MSVKELFDLLKTITVDSQAIPVAYDHFEENVGYTIVPPFILFRNNDATTIKADDKVHYQDNNFIVDLVVVKKDEALEQQLEKLFTDNYIPYDKEEAYIDNERIYQERYFI